VPGLVCANAGIIQLKHHDAGVISFDHLIETRGEGLLV
jgi:hypothetical protein